jgi:arylsulfatase
MPPLSARHSLSRRVGRVAIGLLAVGLLAGGLVDGGAGCARAPSPPPIVLVSLDTLRADRLGVYGNPDGLTPNLDAFAASSIVFDHAWSQANQTNLSHASLFTSRYPSELGAIANGFSPASSIPTLASVLAVYGYRTAAFTGGAHLTRGFGLERGFQTWETPQELGSLYHTLPPALAWLDAHADGAPFLLFLHSYDTHQRYLKPSPVGLAWTDPGYHGAAQDIVRSATGTSQVVDDFAFPDNAQGELPLDLERLRLDDAGAHATILHKARARGSGATRLGAADEAYIRAAYDGAVAYADGWFGALAAGLSDRGLLDTAVIVVLSDHGESLGENGLWGHSWSLTDADLHVPLIVRLPGGRGGGAHVVGQVALLDVLPTLLELAGASPPAEIHGTSLVPALAGGPGPARPAVFSEGTARMISARSPTERVTFTGVDANSPFLTDLLHAAALDGPAFAGATTADPARRAALRDAMLAWRADLVPAPVFEHADPALVKGLQEHGYWEPR